MKGFSLAAAIFSASGLLWASVHPAAPKPFHAELIEPGKTTLAALHELVGKPARVLRESPHHEYLFYDLGQGAAMDATVSIRDGVVDYVSYLCDDKMRDVRAKFGTEPSSQRAILSSASGYASSLTQVLFESRGRGYVYEPKTMKVRACMAWEPGRKFEELGK